MGGFIVYCGSYFNSRFCFISLLLIYYASSSILAFRNITFSIYGRKYEELEIIISTLERFVATVFARWYEKSRMWLVLAFALNVTSVLVYIEFANRHRLQATIPTRNVQLLFALLSTLSLFLLLFVNRIKSRNGRARSALSERYQVTENIKALRIMVPVSCLDTSVQIMFLATDIFLNIGQVLNLNNCYDDDWYLTKFLVFRMISFVMQYSIPPTVIFHFSSFLSCTSIRRGPVKRLTPVSPSSDSSPFSVVTIQNVFGMTVSGDDYGPQGQDTHFRNLYSQWS
uniref:Uncharacterized protein n=1 Tax=Caenorhabditis japonica TaxID=281687 RepID=A0A8R1E2D8_CAEJA